MLDFFRKITVKEASKIFVQDEQKEHLHCLCLSLSCMKFYKLGGKCLTNLK